MINTNKDISVENNSDKPDAYGFKVGIKSMLVHFSLVILMIFCLALAISKNNTIMAVAHTFFAMTNAYYFLMRYNEINEAIDKMFPPSVNLEKN